MKILGIFSVSAVVLASIITNGCSVRQPSTEEEVKALSKKFNAIIDEYFDEYLKLYPLFATSIGDNRYNDKLTITISEGFRQTQKKLIEGSLEKAKRIPCKFLEKQDRLTCAMFMQDLKNEANLLKVDLDYLMPFNQFNSFFSDFAELASGASFITFDTEEDYENFLKRCSVVPAYIDTMISNMEEGIRKDVTTPKVLVEQGLAQLKALLVPNYKDSVFYYPLKTIDSKMPLEKSGPIKEKYEKMIQEQIYPAYQKLQKFVEDSYLAHARRTYGLCEIPGGKDFYSALIKSYTTTDLSPRDIQAMGKKEVKRIYQEFEAVKKKMGFKGDMKEFFASLKQKTPALYPFNTADQVIDAYWSIYKKVMEKIPLYFHLVPKAKFTIKEVEKFKAENASEAYQNPSEDGSRPGVFWVPIPDPKAYPVKDMECMFLHEAIPGHHFQIAIQQELPDLCRYRRFMGNTSYIEGWALYSESLGKDLGMYENPYQWVGRLTLEMHRAIRLVVDTGIHWYGWSREQAIQYSLENEPEDLKSIASEIDRYMAIPGQAVSYKVGELKIQELKKRAKTMLQSDYSDAEFHDLILENGSLPLSVLGNEVDRFIRSKLESKRS